MTDEKGDTKQEKKNTCEGGRREEKAKRRGGGWSKKKKFQLILTLNWGTEGRKYSRSHRLEGKDWVGQGRNRGSPRERPTQRGPEVRENTKRGWGSLTAKGYPSIKARELETRREQMERFYTGQPGTAPEVSGRRSHYEGWGVKRGGSRTWKGVRPQGLRREEQAHGPSPTARTL